MFCFVFLKHIFIFCETYTGRLIISQSLQVHYQLSFLKINPSVSHRPGGGTHGFEFACMSKG